MSSLARYTITMSDELFNAFDQRNAKMGYGNRSEAIRDLVREALIREEWNQPDQRVVAVLTIVYDHHARGLTAKLTDLQHGHEGEIVSSLHVHLDHHNCLEVIVLRGVAREVRQLADALSVLKGVKHSNITLTTEGRDLA